MALPWNMALNRKDDPTGLPGLGGLPLAGTGAPTAASLVPDPYSVTTSTTHTGGGSSGGSRTTVVPTQKALALDDAMADPVEGLAAKEAAIGEKERQRAEKLAQQRAASLAAEEADRADASRARIAAMEAEKAKDEAALAKYQDQKPSDYWADKSAGQKFLAGLGVALGAIGSGLTGRSNSALELLNAKEQEHYNREKDRIAKEWQTFGARTGMRTQSNAISEERMRDLDAKRLAKGKWELAQTEIQLGKLGLSEADITKDTRYLKAAEKVNRILAEQEANRATRVTSTSNRQAPSTTTSVQTVTGAKPGAAGAVPGGKLSEGEQKSADYLNRMVEDEKIIRSVPPVTEEGRKMIREQAALEALAEKNPTADALAKVVAGRQTLEEKLSADDRRAYKAGSRLAATSLRGDSGAAISAGEYLNFDRQYLPGQGDKETDLADKENSRRVLLEGMATRTGRPQEHLPKIQALPKQTNVGSAGRIGSVNGKAARIFPDGTYEYLDNKGN